MTMRLRSSITGKDSPDEPLTDTSEGEDDEDPALNENGCQCLLVGHLPDVHTPLNLVHGG